MESPPSAPLPSHRSTARNHGEPPTDPSRVASTGSRLVGRAIVLAVAAGIVWFVWNHPWNALVVVLLTPIYSPMAIGIFPGVWRRRADELPAPATDLERRRRVWDALSALYLDTELDELAHEQIAAVLVASGYSAGQLEEILYRELHPVLHANLLSVAGEWAGFDLEWLEDQILRRSPRTSRFAIIPGKWMVRGSWAAIEALLPKPGK